MKKVILLAVMVSMFVVACGKIPSENPEAKSGVITAETSEKVTGGNKGVFQGGRMH